MVLGHEAAGGVVACGSGVDDLSPGEPVIFWFVPACGAGAPCAEGRPALCEPGTAANAAGTLLSGEIRLSANGRPVHHHVGVSAFAGHAVVSRRSLAKAPDDVPFEVLALFGCAVLTGVGAVVNTASVRLGDRVAVVGLGGVGLAAVLGAVAAGARDVLALDVNPGKAAMAEALGATFASAQSQDAVGTGRDMTSGGVDAAVETAGVAAALQLAYDITRRGGRTVTAGLANPAARMSLAPVQLVAEERTLKGSFLGGGVPSRDIARSIALWKAGRLPVDQLHTGTSPLGEINAAFDALDRGEVIRHVVTP